MWICVFKAEVSTRIPAHPGHELKAISVLTSSSSSLKSLCSVSSLTSSCGITKEKKKDKAHNHLQCLSAHLQTSL